MCTGSYNNIGNPIITITRVFPGNNVGTTFSIDNLLSPPTTEPIDQLTISTFSVEGNGYDTCDTTVSGVVENQLSSIIVQGINGLEVDTYVGIQIRFSPVDTVSAEDSFFVDFSSNYFPTFNFVNISGSSSFTPQETSSSYINFTQNKLIKAGADIVFNLYSFHTPPSVAETNPFTITVSTYGYAKMSGTFTIQAEMVQIPNITLSPTNYAIKSLNAYHLVFNLDNGIRSSGAIKVRFPV